MTPGARLQMAIEILEGLDATAQPVDRFLKFWFRTRRFAGSGDRRAIAERVFEIQRHRAEYAHRMGDDSARALAIASAAGEDLAALFSGGYGPAPLTDAERAALAAMPTPAPGWVTGEYPQWLEGELQRAFGLHLADEMAALKARAPVDLRVNTLKAGRGDVLAALHADGFHAQATPHAPHGIRLPPGDGNAALARSPLFLSGAFEFQDEAAQLAAWLAGAQPGQRVLDLAAGAGGKALALAAAMQNRGTIVAFDDDPARLAPLAERAARAGASCIASTGQRTGPAWDGGFDLVFLDTPCSGTGTWRRQPELRWRLTPQRLAELNRIQDSLLDEAAHHTRPGGRLVYATCSVLPCENQDRIAGFLTRNPAFSLVNLGQGRSLPGLEADLRASPATTGTDGFYCAGLKRA